MSLETINKSNDLTTILSLRQNEFRDSRVYNKWEKDGDTWTIEDVNPKDDQEAMCLMLEHFITDEPMFARFEILNDVKNVRMLKNLYTTILSSRLSIACYRISNGNREIVAVNLCTVKIKNDPPFDPLLIGQETLRLIFSTIKHCHVSVDLFKEFDIDNYLSGGGMIVRPDCRGQGLGSKLLNAREHLCKKLGIRASGVIFTSPVAQRMAERSGFQTIKEFSLTDLAKVGFTYPGDQSQIIKFMARLYS